MEIINTFMVLMCILSSTKAWILDVSHDTVIAELSQDIEFNCYPEDKDIKLNEDVYRIRIVNQKNPHYPLAKIRNSDRAVTGNLKHANSTGHADKSSNSFLRIHIEKATEEMIGEIKCLVRYMDFSQIVTKPVTVAGSDMNNPMLLQALWDYNTQNKLVKGKMDKEIDVKYNLMMHVIEDISTTVLTINTELSKIKTTTNSIKKLEQQVAGDLNVETEMMVQLCDAISKDLEVVTGQANEMNTEISDLSTLSDDLILQQSNSVKELNTVKESMGTQCNNLTQAFVNLTERVAKRKKEFVDKLTGMLNETTRIREATYRIKDQQHKNEENFAPFKKSVTTKYNNISTKVSFTSYLDTRYSLIDDTQDGYSEELNKKNIGFKTKLEKNSKLASKILNKLEVKNVLMIPTETWPTGQYAILRPVTGCPNTRASNWTFSSARISTGASSDNRDTSSKSLSLSGTVFETDMDGHRYVNLEMCSMISKNGSGLSWPSGTYCIQQHGFNCTSPTFGRGEIHFGRFNDGILDRLVNLPPLAYPKKTTIKFCCRGDAATNTSIILPPKQPFFLYRYGGVCQQVNGMTVSNQWIRFDTDSENHKVVGHSPDVSINDFGIRIEVCYYTPSEL